MSTQILFYLNDMTLELDGLQNGIDGSFLNAATVLATLKDCDGDEVSGQSWPLTLVYVTDSDGTYRSKLDAAVEVTVDEVYVAEVTAVEGGLKGRWDLPLVVKLRKFT